MYYIDVRSIISPRIPRKAPLSNSLRRQTAAKIPFKHPVLILKYLKFRSRKKPKKPKNPPETPRNPRFAAAQRQHTYGTITPSLVEILHNKCQAPSGTRSMLPSVTPARPVQTTRGRPHIGPPPSPIMRRQLRQIIPRRPGPVL